ncbi:TPA: hypothetical protein JG914_004527 [Enterobacter hormaechei subsp. steigerwaltii]|nr:hypothetical protein [Enterobacter hormaechei subsp. steigerwaltii]
MSAKARFLNKLQDHKARNFDNRADADIAAFRQRVSQLQDTMESWLGGTQIRINTFSTSVVEFLIGGGAFSISGIELCYQQQSIRFKPVFLYGLGVTGCVEASLCRAGLNNPLYCLFMRNEYQDTWSWLPAGTISRQSSLFDEETFFMMIEPLLPD